MRHIATSVIAMLCAAALAGAAHAESVTFDMENWTFWDLQVEFYAADGNRAWPGGDEVYILEEDDWEEYQLECVAGEKICFGAWVGAYDDPDVYWGVGAGGTEGCEGCCAICDGGVSSYTLE